MRRRRRRRLATPPAAGAAARPAPKGWGAAHTLAHKKAVTTVAFGPDLVAAGDEGGTPALWDAATGREKEKLFDAAKGGARRVDRVQVSRDAKWLYVVTDGENVHQVSVAREGRVHCCAHLRLATTS